MKIPKKIKVGGIIYSISIVKEVIGGSSSNIEGLTNFENCTIQIRYGNQLRMEETFFHEIFHCINNELNEIDTSFYATMIYQVLKENKFIK